MSDKVREHWDSRAADTGGRTVREFLNCTDHFAIDRAIEDPGGYLRCVED